MHNNASHIIHAIKKRATAVAIASCVFVSVGISFPLFWLLHILWSASWWWTILMFAPALTVVLLTDRAWRITEKEVVRFLDSQYSSLEESSALLLRDDSALNLLEQLQRNKTALVLTGLDVPVFLNARFRAACWFVLAMATLCVAASVLVRVFPAESIESFATAKSKSAKLPVGMRSVSIHVVPPAYMHEKETTQSEPDLRVEEGSLVEWMIITSSPVHTMSFIYNDSLQVQLQPADTSGTHWKTNKHLEHPGFYQVKMDSVVSELYKIEVITDQMPLITVQSPKPTTVIDYGEPEKASLQVAVSDDHGIDNVSINATVAKGSGEGVKFVEKKISFDASFGEKKQQYLLQKTIGLRALDMEPGDELYFYLNAKDTHGQEKRSDVFIISIADTARLMSMDGVLNSINLKPDYFRSQRQIIIETEQLLRDKDTMSAQAFNDRSNNLGIDQKLLRLRYGKFLGEEATSNESSTENSFGNPEDFGNAALILDAFTDRHDNSEDATFFDPETKKQLKATLTEMWNAELHLRVFKPQDALAYEYKALRLLKDLQQKSRAYVAKTSIKTSPIKLEKRLTGKLDKITEPVTKTNTTVSAQPSDVLRTAMYLLEQLKTDFVPGERAIQVLRLASVQVGEHASKDPGAYLKPLEAMKRIITQVQYHKLSSVRDIVLSQNALQKMLEVPVRLPFKEKQSPAQNLSEQYFETIRQKENH